MDVMMFVRIIGKNARHVYLIIGECDLIIVNESDNVLSIVLVLGLWCVK